jgi:hypothetical protein
VGGKKGQPSRIVLYVTSLSATSLTPTITTTTPIINQPSSSSHSNYLNTLLCQHLQAKILEFERVYLAASG